MCACVGDFPRLYFRLLSSSTVVLAIIRLGCDTQEGRGKNADIEAGFGPSIFAEWCGFCSDHIFERCGVGPAECDGVRVSELRR